MAVTLVDVPVGATVTWTNTGAAGHAVTIAAQDDEAAAPDDVAGRTRRRDRATPAAGEAVNGQGGGAEPARVPRTGVGTLTLAERSSDLALLAGLAALMLGAGAVVAHRRS